MERCTLYYTEKARLPALTRTVEPEDLDAQIRALRQLQSLPGFIAGMRVAEGGRGGYLERLLASPSRVVSHAFSAIRKRWSLARGLLFGKERTRKPRSVSSAH